MTTLQQSIELRSGPPRFFQMAAAVRRIFVQSISILGVLAAWEVAPRLQWVDTTFLPPFSVVVKSAWELARSGQLGAHVEASLLRALAGFVLAVAYAVPLGLVMGWFKGFSDAVSPLVELLRNTAALALLPLFILFLGIGEASKISIIVYACSWPLLLNAIGGVQSVDPLLVKSARTMGVSKAQLFRKVILPAAVPALFVGIRLAASTALVVLVAAEMVGAKAGLGYLIVYAQYNFQIPQMYVGILTITAIGFFTNQALLKVERRFSAWRPSARAEG